MKRAKDDGAGQHRADPTLSIDADSRHLQIAIGSGIQALACQDPEFLNCTVLTSSSSAHSLWSLDVQKRGAGSPCLPKADQVAVFGNDAPIGLCTVKGQGTYADVTAIGLTARGKDGVERRAQPVRSFVVGTQATALVCALDHFEGGCRTLSAGKWRLFARSLKIDPAPEVPVPDLHRDD